MNDAPDDHVSLSLAEDHDGEARWAFGTGFEDPLHGIDTGVPAGTDTTELADVCVALGDDALVAAQRLAQWVTLAPELEEEVALSNIGLDLLGQARLLYSRAGQVDGTGRDEDTYAYLRGGAEFRNVTLTELPNGDFAFSTARLLLLSCWRLSLFERLAVSAPDPVLAAIAAKGINELAYHRQFAADWTLRLGDGTAESHRRMRAALDGIAPHLPELLAWNPGFGISAADIAQEVGAVLCQVLDAATLRLPVTGPTPLLRGREGEHTEHLAPLLDELQGLARTHPQGAW
ncbi:1,2-phenylacetyl-CoA epoxidase subunit PaaC [Streptomyces sp. NPDC048211]|uniref:1,2-phenylacetyl-CoA epoxidase subunit PaaC n=1 Tax=Streptomyces sp. NPDC048211 TaxID=3365516 RepID=UPI003715E968